MLLFKIYTQVHQYRKIEIKKRKRYLENQKKAGVAPVIPDKIEFKTQKLLVINTIIKG